MMSFESKKRFTDIKKKKKNQIPLNLDSKTGAGLAERKIFLACLAKSTHLSPLGCTS